MRRTAALAAFALLAFASPRAAHAQGQVVVYCSVLQDWCNLMSQEFERRTGIRVAMTQKGSGETLAQLRAEAQNPRADVWWGGTGDPHLQAAEANLTAEYRSPKLGELHPWAQAQARQSNHRTVGIYAGVLGFAWNTRELARKNLQPPRCWSDVAEARFKDEVQISNPTSSGTAYTVMATLVQVMGEDPAFAYLRRLHANVNQYTRSGPAPARAVARGETLIGIMFLHDAVAEAVEGAPVAVAAPCEGTGYEIGSMSIVRGARNMANARAWYEFALDPQVQMLGARAKSYQTPSHRQASPPPQAPRLEDTKLIDYDFAKYGATAERTRLIQRWEREVGNQAR
ncbi:MAG: ABC transporter substrate-binding protein [Tagaea sp.]